MRAGDDFSREPRRPRRDRPARGAPVPRDDRRAMKGFVRSRRGVEAYLEPKTLNHPATVVLVAADGEWLRFALPDDRFIQKFSRKHALPVYDAGKLGYPRRMKEYRRRSDEGTDREPGPE